MSLRNLKQSEIDWLISQNVKPESIVSPSPIMAATGRRAHDGIFEPRIGDDRETGELNGAWFVIETPTDRVFWQPKSGSIATENNTVFGLGDELVDSAGTCAAGGYLFIFETPLRWLQCDRRGIFIIDWKRAFDMLRWTTRVAVDETILAKYQKAMRPKVPEIFVTPFTEQSNIIEFKKRGAP